MKLFLRFLKILNEINQEIMGQEQSEYLNKYLPYRINSMLAPDLMAYRRSSNISKELIECCYQDSLVLEPAFEISIIFGRALLHFLGIDYDRKLKGLKVFKPREDDDATIQSIFPGKTFCPLNDTLVIQHKAALCLIIKIANKSVAHFTSDVSNEHEHRQLEEARKAIYRLILKYIPEINKKNIWWYMEVETQNES